MRPDDFSCCNFTIRERAEPLPSSNISKIFSLLIFSFLTVVLLIFSLLMGVLLSSVKSLQLFGSLQTI